MSVPPLATGFLFPASVRLSKLSALKIWVLMEVKPLQRLQQPVAPDFLGTFSPEKIDLETKNTYRLLTRFKMLIYNNSQ